MKAIGRGFPFWLAMSMSLLPIAWASGINVDASSSLVTGALTFRTNSFVLQMDGTGALHTRHLATSEAGRVSRFGVAELDRAARLAGVTEFEREFPAESPPAVGSGAIDFTSFWIAHLEGGAHLDRAIEIFRQVAGVMNVSPIAQMPMQAMPNDSLWSIAYHLFQSPSRRDIHAPEAWDVTKGDTSVVVAIVDTGIFTDHPDLGGTAPGSGNIWTNWAEHNGVAGVDDDENGYVDDDHGWDFVHLTQPRQTLDPDEDNLDPDNDPNDLASHGTAVAGIIGAITDNVSGVSGTVWNTRLMPLRAGYKYIGGSGTDASFAAMAIRYATRAGASVINCSFDTPNQIDLNAALAGAAQAGVTVVIAGGNNTAFEQGYATGYPYVAAVGAVDANDVVTLFSSRRPTIDLAAPGIGIQTTGVMHIAGQDSVGRRFPFYGGFSGTSAAAPQVAGAVALLQARRLALNVPPLDPVNMVIRLAETADDIATLNPGGSGYGTGRLNMHRFLTENAESHAVPAIGLGIGPCALLRTVDGASRIVVADKSTPRLWMVDESGDVLWIAALSALPWYGAATADLGSNRGPGIFVATRDGKVAGITAFGQPMPGWPVTATGSTNVSNPMPSLGDIDGDGEVDVVWGGNDGRVHAWHVDGSVVSGFPSQVSGPGRNVFVALTALDSVAGAEIVSVGKNGEVRAVRGDGSLIPGWNTTLSAFARPHLIVGWGSSSAPVVIVPSFDAGFWSLYVFSSSGLFLRSLPLPGQPRTEMAAADLVGDGADEIVVGTDHAGGNVVTMIDSSGAAVLSTVEYSPIPRHQDNNWAPVVGNVGANSEGIVISVGSILAFDTNGALLPGFPKPANMGGAPCIADVDDDGSTDIFGVSMVDTALTFFFEAGDSTAMPTVSSWPTERGNYARTRSRLYSAPEGLIRVSVDPAQARSEVQFRLTGPNPTPGVVQVTFSLPRAGLARLELLDVGGRLVANRSLGYLGAGIHSRQWNTPEPVRSGIYWIRMRSDVGVASQRVCIIR